MNNIGNTIEIELEPIPPDTVSSGRTDIVPLIEQLLKESGRDGLLSSGDLRIDVQQPFPTDAVIVVIFTLLSGMALETYKALIIPWLGKRFKITIKPKEKA